MKKQILENVIIGGGASGLSAAKIISKKTKNWAIIERDYPASKSKVGPTYLEILKSNIPSSKEENAHYWLNEFETDGWFSSSGNFCWGRVPMKGGRSNLWSGWSPLISKENLVKYAAGIISDEQSFYQHYMNIRKILNVTERPTYFFDQPPYGDPKAELKESKTFSELQRAFAKEGIETTLMPRPERSKYNTSSSLFPNVENIEKHSYKGTVTKISSGQDQIKKLIITTADRSSYHVFAKKVFLAASAIESTRLLADAYGQLTPKEIGKNIHDHIYVRNAIVFKIPEKNPERFNTKLYGKPFIFPEFPNYRMALQISATQADQISTTKHWIGTIAIIGEVPPSSHGEIQFTSSRDQLNRLLPHINYNYSSELKVRIGKTVIWLSEILKEQGVEVLSTSTQVSRPGESLHEMGGLNDKIIGENGKVKALDSVYVCDGSGYNTFGPEHPCLAISAFAMYVADIAIS